MEQVRRAILIGNSQFPADPKLTPLRCPENDVEGLRKLLSSAGQGYCEVITLTNEGCREVLTAVEEALGRARAGELVLIYYSGHGIPDRAGRLCLAAKDTKRHLLGSTSIEIEKVLEFIRLSPCKSRVLILDCCFSGSVGDSFLRGDVEDRLLRASRSAGTYIVTASTASGTATEKAEDEYGLLTKYIIRGIETGEADPDEDGQISMDGLYKYVHRRVQQESPQEPLRFALEVRGDLIIARSGKMSREERRKQIRAMMLDFAREDRIPDRLFRQALEVLALPLDDLHGDLRKGDDLLRRLLAKELALDAFKDRWYDLNLSEPGWRPSPPAVISPKMEAPEAGTVRTNPDDGQAYVWIPPGEFQMGCSPGDNECQDIEKPQHTVRITRGFWLGQTPITVGAYRRFAESTGISMPREPAIGKRSLNPRWSDSEQPMVVWWAEAKAYCETWANGRLPSEAEWEYAARVGTSGSRYGKLDAIAWYGDNSGSQRLDSARAWEKDAARELTKYFAILEKNGNRIHPVKQKEPNAWGLYDMLGNVWEWVADFYWHKYYQTLPSTAIDPKGPGVGMDRMVRGGSWVNGPWVARASHRGTWLSVPGGVGFRCAREVIP